MKKYKITFHYNNAEGKLRTKMIEITARSGNEAIEKLREQFGEITISHVWELGQ